MRGSKQSSGVGTSVSMRTLSGGKQFPGSTGFLLLFPLEATRKQVKRIDFLWMSLRAGLKIGVIENLIQSKGGVIKPGRCPRRDEAGIAPGFQRCFGERGCRYL